jgi:hypothetical protein
MFYIGVWLFCQPWAISFAQSIAQQDSCALQLMLIDALDQPVEFATIRLFCDPSTKISCVRAQSDEQGRAIFRWANTAQHSIRIEIRALGSRDTSTWVTCATSSLQIKLSAKEAKLKEVVIKTGKIPIRNSSDTTFINISPFRDSTERTIEDLLKKIPGFDVREGGQLYYYDRPLEKVLIEGEDMLGRNYTVATKSLNPGILEQLQVLDNYEENQVLKPQANSGKQVLNLVLSGDKSLSGGMSIGAGAGKEGKGEINLNMLAIRKKNKAFVLSSAGNTGAQMGKEEIEAVFFDENTSALTNDNKASHKALLHYSVPPGKGNADRPFYDNAQNIFNGFRSTRNHNEQLKLKCFLNQSFTKDIWATRQTARFVPDPARYNLLTEEQNRYQESYYDGEMRAVYTPHKDTRFEYAYFGNHQNIKPFQQYVTHFLGETDSMANQYADRAYTPFELRTDNTFRIFGKWASRLYGQVQRIKSRQVFTTDGAYFLQNHPDSKQFQQQIETEKNAQSIDYTLYFAQKSLVKQIYASFRQQRITLDAIDAADDNKIGTPIVYTLKTTQLAWKMHLEKRLGSLTTTVSVGAAVQKNQGTQFNTPLGWALSPIIQIKLFTNSKKHNIFYDYMYVLNDPDNATGLDYWAAPTERVLLNWLEFPIKKHRFSYLYKRESFLKVSSSQFRLRAERATDKFGNNSTFDRQITTVSRINIRQPQYNINSFWKFEKFFIPIKILWRLQLSANYGTGWHILAREAIRFNTTNCSASLLAGLKIAKHIKINGENTLQYGWNGAVKTLINESKGTVYMKKGTTDFSLSMRHRYISIDGPFNQYLLNCRLGHETVIFKKSIVFSLRIENMLNRRNGSFAYGSDAWYFQDIISTVPAFMLLTAEFNWNR